MRSSTVARTTIDNRFTTLGNRIGCFSSRVNLLPANPAEVGDLSVRITDWTVIFFNQLLRAIATKITSHYNNFAVWTFLQVVNQCPAAMMAKRADDVSPSTV
jgi:hypothetical protein